MGKFDLTKLTEFQLSTLCMVNTHEEPDTVKELVKQAKEEFSKRHAV